MNNERSSWAIRINRGLYRVSRRWLAWFILVAGVYVTLPWFAPVLMKFGLEKPAKVIYFVYSFLCHQLPQRSYFLFGPQATYSLERIQDVWQNTFNPTILRRFIGNAELGYKVAWSDRMVSMYTSIPLGAMLWWPLRKRLRQLPLWGLGLFTLPIVIDGGTHMISDLAGIGQGFRDSNLWLVELTNSTFPTAFYAGDALGSFNSWMRIITGLLFGFAIVLFSMPALHEAFFDITLQIKTKFARAGVDL